MAATVRDVLHLVELSAPSRLAEEWDNPGLMVGRPGAGVKTTALALDATVETIRAAAQAGADLLLTHHPLFFKPIRNLNPDRPADAAAAEALRRDMAVIAAHTNLDSAAAGVNDSLAHSLGLTELRPLAPADPPAAYKLVAFTPSAHLEDVRRALFRAGAGGIGHYSDCSFAAAGQGSYTPEEGASPFVGTAGRMENTEEMRLEVVVPAEALGAVKKALRQAHPFEEPACDVYPLVGGESGEGLGRVGRMTPAVPFAEMVSRTAEALGTSGLRTLPPAEDAVSVVAVVGGSGGSMVAAAGAAGAQVLITGDVGYHQARDAEAAGLGIIDAGHFATERPVLDPWAGRLERLAAREKVDVKFIVLDVESDPWIFREG